MIEPYRIVQYMSRANIITIDLILDIFNFQKQLEKPNKNDAFQFAIICLLDESLRELDLTPIEDYKPAYGFSYEGEGISTSYSWEQ